jgi:hypothetical protein
MEGQDGGSTEGVLTAAQRMYLGEILNKGATVGNQGRRVVHWGCFQFIDSGQAYHEFWIEINVTRLGYFTVADSLWRVRGNWSRDDNRSLATTLMTQSRDRCVSQSEKW